MNLNDACSLPQACNASKRRRAPVAACPWQRACTSLGLRLTAAEEQGPGHPQCCPLPGQVVGRTGHHPRTGGAQGDSEAGQPCPLVTR